MSEATVALALAATELFSSVSGVGLIEAFWDVLSQIAGGLRKVESEDIQGRVPDDLESLIGTIIGLILKVIDDCPT
jgi:hypothetical protein